MGKKFLQKKVFKWHKEPKEPKIYSKKEEINTENEYNISNDKRKKKGSF